MQIEKFEDLIAWQKSQSLTIKIFRLFGNVKNFGFRDQVTRASISISNNIAEGFSRESNKEFKRFLFIARGSCSELKSMIYLAFELKYVDKIQAQILLDECEEISKILRGLIKSITRRS